VCYPSIVVKIVVSVVVSVVVLVVVERLVVVVVERLVVVVVLVLVVVERLVVVSVAVVVERLRVVEMKVKRSVTVMVVPPLPRPAAASSLTENDAMTGTAKPAPSTNFFRNVRLWGSTLSST
jgi:hypothetical protein